MPRSLSDNPPSARRQTIEELRELQRLAFAAVSFPLSRNHRMQRTWRDGQPMKRFVAQFIKPNDRLSSFERLEIYNRQYWFRLMDCLWDDYPGLRAILGEAKFRKLRIAYLTRYPSRSFTLRNLGSRLVQFLREEPRYTRPRQALCLDMARFEWAQVETFDAQAKPPLGVDDLLGRDPAGLRLGLQPHITLLELGYPLDEFVLAIKKQESALRGETSNAVEEVQAPARARRVPLPKPGTVFLAVHRFENSIYYKRLEADAYRVLTALRDGATLADACMAAAEGSVDPQQLAASFQEWFRNWTQMGWFVH